MFELKGIIERRLLINFRVDPQIAKKLLPEKFSPQLVEGHAVVGICLIRLAAIRPSFLPSFIGLGSENAAHRFAVEWDERGQKKKGVYIPRRDTSLWLNTLVGGRIFPGVHHLAQFHVEESEPSYRVAFQTQTDDTFMEVQGKVSDSFPKDSIFKNIENSSQFFKLGALGYSPGLKEGNYQGLELVTDQWQVKNFDVSKVKTSYFSDENNFPPGSIQFDHALIMKNLKHSWKVGTSIESD